MTIARNILGRLRIAAAMLLVAATPVVAQDTPVAQCRGDDMLAELENRAPEIHKQVLAEAGKIGNAEAVLWKVEKDGVAPSYLFGTMHLSDARIATLSPKTKDAIKNSKVVALEVADLSENAIGAAMAKAAELVVYTDGRNLQSQLSEDEFKKVQELVAKSGMPGEFAGMFRPWIVSMLLSLSDCERKQVASGAAVLDMRVAEEAQKNGLEVTGLETVEAQLGALAAVPDDQQIQMLKVGLKYADRADDMMETLVQMYLQRRINAAMPFQIALAAEQGTPASAFDGFQKTLLTDRNATMRDGAKALLEKGGAFVAVGALHLPGPSGLVNLVREAGYTVTPVE